MASDAASAIVIIAGKPEDYAAGSTVAEVLSKHPRGRLVLCEPEKPSHARRVIYLEPDSVLLPAHTYELLPGPVGERLGGMTTEEFRQAGHQLIDWIADYRERVDTLPVRSAVEPGYLREHVPAHAPVTREPWSEIMKDLDTAILPGITHWQSANFFAYFKPHASYASVLAEALSAGLNAMGFSWISSPVVTELELLCCDWFAQLLGLPPVFCSGVNTRAREHRGGGCIQGSAGEAVVVALLAARSRALHGLNEEERHARAAKLVVYFSDQAHSILQKAMMILGFETSSYRVIKARRSNNFALDPADVAAAIRADREKGFHPLFVCATMGTTSSTAMDPIAHIASEIRLIEEEGALDSSERIWFHVDAAYGGAYCVCPEFRRYFAGIENVDSVVVNAHKKLMVSFDCALLFVRDRTFIEEALSLTPEYLRNEASELGAVIDLKDWQLPLGRRFRALKLWMTARDMGQEGLQENIRHGVELAQRFERYVVDSPLFELFTPRTLALVCFRLRDGSNQQQKDLLDACNRTGKIFFIHTALDDHIVLRLAVGGLEQKVEHIDAAWHLISEEAGKLL